MKNNQIRIITVIGIIILLGVGAYLLSMSKSNSNKQATETPQIIDNTSKASSSQTEEGTGLTNVGITVDDQNPGRIVVVSQAFLNSSAWVVIQEDTNGTPGNILGARLFEKGSNSGIIQLLNSMKVGKSYFAVVHTEDGDGVFNLKKDLVLKGADGKNVMTKFSATLGSDKPQ